MQPDTYGFLNLRVMDGITVGTTATLLGSGERRSAIKIAALSGPVWFKFGGAMPPTISESDFHDLLAEGDSTAWMGLSELIPLWVWAPRSSLVNVIEASY